MRLTCERNRNLSENQNSTAFIDNSAKLTDNSTTRIPDALNEKSAEFLIKPAI
jgi:hypothetical protein